MILRSHLRSIKKWTIGTGSPNRASGTRNEPVLDKQQFVKTKSGSIWNEMIQSDPRDTRLFLIFQLY